VSATVGVQIIRFTMAFLINFFDDILFYISLTLIKIFRTKLSDKYGGYCGRYLPLQMCYPDLQRLCHLETQICGLLDLWVSHG